MPVFTDPPIDIPPAFLSTQVLIARGLSPRKIERLVRAGRLLRVRRGRYVPAGTPADLVRVAGLGGRLDCVSLLTHMGVFVLENRDLHMQVTVGSSRLPRRPADVVCHWRVSRAGREELRADLIEALAQACRCQDPRAAIATLDNAWHLGLIGESDIAEIFALLPARFRSLRPLLDPRSESGSESIMRLMLRMLGCTVDVQVAVTGVGRVDFIVDGWLIIECDSEAHHSGWKAQKRDRRRDLVAATLGYATIRPIAEDILYHRDEVWASIKEVIESRGARLAAHNSSLRPHRRRRDQAR